MADQKIDPNRPKNDPNAAGTSFQPLATPPVGPSGQPLPLGAPTLEAQRKAFAAATTPASGNPLGVTGVQADVENAKSNPEASGPAGRTKEDVQAQAKQTQKDVKAQAKQAQAAQAAPKPAPVPATTPSTDVGRPGPAPAHVTTPVTPAQPAAPAPAPAPAKPAAPAKK